VVGSGTHALIEHNIIRENSSSDVGGLFDCDGTIRNNWILKNVARHGGGLRACDGLIENNFIVGNEAIDYFTLFPWIPQPSGRGGGLFGCHGIIRNNTLVRNFSNSVRGDAFSACSGVILNCIVWGFGYASDFDESTTPIYSCLRSAPSGGIGNIEADPLFVDPVGLDGEPETSDDDYRLSPVSPAIDAGHPDPSVYDACRPPGMGGPRNDMGAYGGPGNCGWPAGPVAPELSGIVDGLDPAAPVVGKPFRLLGRVENRGFAQSTSSIWVEVWAVDPDGKWAQYLCDSYDLGPMKVGQAVIGIAWARRSIWRMSFPPGSCMMRFQPAPAQSSSGSTPRMPLRN
jgi:hypothetical protein